MSDEARSETTAWGVLCDECGLLPFAMETREKARALARQHRAWYMDPKPAVAVVRVRTVLVLEPEPQP